MKHANLGLGPWDVLSDGLAGLTGMQFGTVSIIIGILVLLLWIPIREKPGLATVLSHQRPRSRVAYEKRDPSLE